MPCSQKTWVFSDQYISPLNITLAKPTATARSFGHFLMPTERPNEKHTGFCSKLFVGIVVKGEGDPSDAISLEDFSVKWKGFSVNNFCLPLRVVDISFVGLPRGFFCWHQTRKTVGPKCAGKNSL